MPFGEIITGAFQLIWRQKKLLLFSLIGLALYAVGLLIYQLAIASWIGRYFDWINTMMVNPDPSPSMMGDFFTGMAGMWIGAAVFMLLSLLSYFVGLVTTSGLILEASRARDGEPVDVGRGLRDGLGRAGHLFLVQLAWLLPGLLIGCAAFASFFVLIFGLGAAAGNESDRVAGILGISWFACIFGAFCLGLIYAAISGIFQPLMAQSAVAGRRSAGAAIREGWALVRANLGGVIIVWLLVMLLSFAVYILIQTISSIVSLPLMAGWFASFGRMFSDAQNGTMPQFPAMSTPLFLLASLISLVVSLIGMWLLQTIVPVVWNGVYRHLTRPIAPVVEDRIVPADGANL